MLTDLFIAMTSTLPFSVSWKRLRHMRHGHGSNTTRLDKLHSEKHPHTDAEVIFTVNVCHCNDCGLTFLDDGMEFRAGHPIGLVLTPRK